MTTNRWSVASDHLWSVQDRYARGPTKVLPTREIAKNFLLNSGERRYTLPVAGPIDCNGDANSPPIHPYVLGAWLGDGTSATNHITIGDIDAGEMVKHLRACGEECYSPTIVQERKLSGAISLVQAFMQHPLALKRRCG